MFDLNYFSLEGKTALVTGARTGIGQAISVGLASLGAKVLLLGHQNNLSETKKKIEEVGGDYDSVIVDLSDTAAIRSHIRPILENYDIDILINNAGVIHRQPAAEFDEEAWMRVIDVNLNAVFILSQEIGKQMIQRGTGKVINIASLLSFQGGVFVPAYAASKHAVSGLTKSLANEWAGKGIQVNAIAPGYIETNNTEAIRSDKVRNESILARIPTGRWGKPADLIGAAAFLASPASDYVNGHTLIVDGGWMGR
ncbi:2-dehydro-3-deoxy-D-gluconate 5-dehydrogenase KduD [Radiobacillus kanasensis]|uniref:2-dehydro-3-deoxy-D-gluconate 5-dehydrogenase KduD n=1 Tax=Radiobacillus kanasensis TaxID=2844358 RepID=UPI001E3FA2C2|nr:2-dehydro-3-deoxy-D-gluconate 5-dehydrogenase KduD [Radiobacillus kanasensis]UFU01434.1 2-dehydro-3-deoxy-D-gluconate 5-dehydrogenase KduD [Radiobacillus kanasensis]